MKNATSYGAPSIAINGATALYGACLAKNEARIKAVEVLITSGDKNFDAELISIRERNWLDSVIEKARAGKWKSAAAMAKQMMEDQNTANGG